VSFSFFPLALLIPLCAFQRPPGFTVLPGLIRPVAVWAQHSLAPALGLHRPPRADATPVRSLHGYYGLGGVLILTPCSFFAVKGFLV